MEGGQCRGVVALCLEDQTHKHMHTHAYHLGTVSRVKIAKVAVYSCPFDAMATETKGTVLIKSANELMEFSKGEEDLIENVRDRGKEGRKGEGGWGKQGGNGGE